MPSFTNSVIIDRKPEEVFDIITNASYWTEWYSDTKKVEGDIDGPLMPGNKVLEVVKVPLQTEIIEWKCVERDFPKSFRIEGCGLNCAGYIAYKFKEIDGKTEFTRTLDISFTKGILKYLQKFFVKTVSKNQAKSIIKLKHSAENTSSKTQTQNKMEVVQ